MNAALANLELVRELYTVDQRNEFFKDYPAALNIRRDTQNALITHLRADPVGWKFWKKRPAEYVERKLELANDHLNACELVAKLRKSHPLLVKIYSYKSEPVVDD